MTFRQFNKINDILTHTNLEILLQEYTDGGYIEKQDSIKMQILNIF